MRGYVALDLPKPPGPGLVGLGQARFGELLRGYDALDLPKPPGPKLVASGRRGSGKARGAMTP